MLLENEIINSLRAASLDERISMISYIYISLYKSLVSSTPGLWVPQPFLAHLRLTGGFSVALEQTTPLRALSTVRRDNALKRARPAPATGPIRPCEFFFSPGSSALFTLLKHAELAYLQIRETWQLQTSIFHFTSSKKLLQGRRSRSQTRTYSKSPAESLRAWTSGASTTRGACRARTSSPLPRAAAAAAVSRACLLPRAPATSRTARIGAATTRRRSRSSRGPPCSGRALLLLEFYARTGVLGRGLAGSGLVWGLNCPLLTTCAHIKGWPTNLPVSSTET